LLALVVTAAQAGAPMTADGVDRVHEEDARRGLRALLEQVAHTGGADADEHLDEIGSGDRKERNVRLSRDRLREERLAGAGRTDEQHTLGDLAAELLELLRILEEVDDLAQLFLGFVDAGDVLERHLVLLLGDQPRARLTEGERLGAAALHLAHEEDPHANEQEHGDPLQEERVPRVGVRRLHRDAHTPVAEHLDEVGVIDDVGPLRLRAVLQAVRDVIAADDDGLDAILLHRAEEFGEVRLLLPALLGPLEHGEEEDDDQADDHPEREVFVNLVHVKEIIDPAEWCRAARPTYASARIVQRTDVRQIAVPAVPVHAIAHHEDVRDRESDVVDVELDLPALDLVEQHAHAQASRMARAQGALEV